MIEKCVRFGTDIRLPLPAIHLYLVPYMRKTSELLHKIVALFTRPFHMFKSVVNCQISPDGFERNLIPPKAGDSWRSMV